MGLLCALGRVQVYQNEIDWGEHVILADGNSKANTN